MKPSKVKDAVRLYMKAGIPCLLLGSPGVGKSAVVSQIAEEDGLEFIDERIGQRDAVDVRGVLNIVEGKGVWTRPDFMPTKGKGILFLDEITSAPSLVQSACYQLVHERRIGEHKLPKGWYVMAAGNKDTDRAVVSRMSSALANRFAHINFEHDLEDWTEYALSHDFLTELIAFIRFRPELLFNFDPKKNEKAFATPRTWEMVSDVLKANGSLDVDLEILTGIVGDGPAAELKGFLDIYRNLPDPAVILMSPDKAEVPEDPATLYAICGALAGKANDSTIANIVKYSNRLPEEFSVLLIKDCHSRDGSVAHTRAFIEWLSKHQDVLT
jgi:MoxR-like ATPase